MSTAPVFESFYCPKNRIPLEGEEEVARYLGRLGRALGGFARVAGADPGHPDHEARARRAFAAGALDLVEHLGRRHSHGAARGPLVLDSTESGFPHFSTLLDLEAERGARGDVLSRLRSGGALRRALRDALLVHRAPTSGIRRALALRSYLEGLAAGTGMAPFAAGEWVPLASGEGRARAFWSCAHYDRASNRPVLTMLWVEAEGAARLSAGDPAADAVEAEARRLTRSSRSLLAFASELDQEVPAVHPRLARRVTLGPFWTPGFTELTGPAGEALARHADHDPFLLGWETETLLAEKESRVDAGLLRRGHLRQVYWIPEDPDLRERGASRVERDLLAPHGFGQILAQEGLVPAHRLHVLTHRNEVLEGS